MSDAIMIALRPDAEVHEQPDGIYITLQGRTTQIPEAASSIRQAIQRLATSGASPAELEKLVFSADGLGGLSHWYFWLNRFHELNLLCYPLEVEQTRIATVLCASSEALSSPPRLPATGRYEPSRFAYCRFDPQFGCLRLETPLSAFSILLHHPSRESHEHLLPWLVFAKMMVAVDETGTSEEDQHPALPYWEFHDLLFHSRSRQGRSLAPFGGTYRFGQEHPPAPVVKPNMSTDVYDLEIPDLERLQAQGPSIYEVLAARRSVRTFDDGHPITLRELGEFLYHVARAELLQDSTPVLSKRPYPAGGALYELELYLAVDHCADLPRGLYQYNPVHHQLCKLEAAMSEVVWVVQQSRRDTLPPDGTSSEPQVLLLITSRLPRLSWKYESIAYAMTLKHTGALYQTLYLVATAMGLAGTAIGSGDTEQFARMTGINAFEETLVGEFLLGTAPASS